MARFENRLLMQKRSFRKDKTIKIGHFGRISALTDPTAKRSPAIGRCGRCKRRPGAPARGRAFVRLIVLNYQK